MICCPLCQSSFPASWLTVSVSASFFKCLHKCSVFSTSCAASVCYCIWMMSSDLLVFSVAQTSAKLLLDARRSVCVCACRKRQNSLGNLILKYLRRWSVPSSSIVWMAASPHFAAYCLLMLQNICLTVWTARGTFPYTSMVWHRNGVVWVAVNADTGRCH